MIPARIYHISRGYRKATCWQSNSTGRRVSVSTTTPVKKLSRKQRYETIYAWLLKQFDIIGPAYHKSGAP